MELYKPFRFWCQKVLPLVYDDSLSYYELLCKVVEHLNKIGNITNATANALAELDSFAHSLIIKPQLEEVLDEWASSGKLDGLLEVLIGNKFKSIDRKILGITNTLQDVSRDDRISHNRVDTITDRYASNGDLSSRRIRFTRGQAPFTITIFNKDNTTYEGTFYALKGQAVKRSPLFLDNMVVEENFESELLMFGNGRPLSIDDFHTGDVFTELYFIKKHKTGKDFIVCATTSGIKVILLYENFATWVGAHPTVEPYSASSHIVTKYENTNVQVFENDIYGRVGILFYNGVSVNNVPYIYEISL